MSIGTCGCDRPHPPGAVMCYVCDQPLAAETRRWTGPSPTEALTARRSVRLCMFCEDKHMRPYPEQPGRDCLVPACECWCSKGMGN